MEDLADVRLRPLIVLSVLLTSLVFLVAIFWVLAWRLAQSYQHERRRYEQGLLEAKQQAEDLARLKTTFLANMSHEIRTPLSGILGFSAVLEEEVTEEQREFTQMITRSGERLLAMLDSLLSLARLDAAAAELQPEPLDLTDEVGRVVQLYQNNARKKQLALTLACAEESLPAELDPASLSMILNNLINNAIKFTESGSVDVFVEATDEQVHLKVQDSGSGISPEFLPHIFDEFRQESSRLSKSHEGAGLGLAITHRLVTMMGGTIQVESTVGVGTTFTVVLPRYAVAPSTQEAGRVLERV
jgi:signal transduction histidine kinase